MRINSDLTYEPERVISIVSPSRAGSTIIKHALCLHPDVCSLAGEEEPYYKLACNGYPWHSSDAFTELTNPELVRSYIANEIHNYQQAYNRRWLQALHIEEPPFIELPLWVTPKPILVLKTPQNCYRRGVLEQLYPNAKITYVRICRQREAIVNGLIDGWNEPGWFEARYVPEWGEWWKFDMPPGWSDHRYFSPEVRSLFQMHSAEYYLDRGYGDAIPVSYEEFCHRWHIVIRRLFVQLGLRDDVTLPETLPMLMATDEPNPERWRTKRPHLEELCKKH
jgi:hypothetical protein